MRVVFVSRDEDDLKKHEFFRDFFQKCFPGIPVIIICGERNKNRFKPRQDVLYAYDGYETFVRQYEKATKQEIISLHSSQATIVPSSLYKSDIRFVYGTPERELALEQYYLVEKAKTLLQNSGPQLILMTGGVCLIRNVIFWTGQYLGHQCYRILNVSYLNPAGKGARYWFCSNSYCRLSGSSNQFGYSENSLYRHTDKLLRNILTDEHKLDRKARTSAQHHHVSFGIKAILRDIYRIKRDNRSYTRLRSLKNYVLNKRLSTGVSNISKPFFLFPVNIPEDSQIILRAPHLSDSLSICEQIANVLPYGHTLVIKEHPAHPGMLDNYRLKTTLKYHRNIFYIDCDVRLIDLLPQATGLITVNSTSALEALARGVPTITIGEAFYKGTGLTYDIEYPLQLQNVLTKVMADPKEKDRTSLLHKTLANLLQETVPEPETVEYTNSDNYLAVIARGIVRTMERHI